MSVFTVYCHGTGFNHVTGAEKDELVAYFHDHTQGAQATLSGGAVTNGTYLINDGPGHSGGAVALPQQINPMTGTQKVDKKHFWTKPTFADHAAGRTGGQQKAAGLRGMVYGTGWDENTQRTVNVIQELKFSHGQRIDTVNMVGWSRGAVTCLRIANLMKEVFGTSIICNIFAVDPVAGADAGNTMVDTRQIGDNVANYVGVLALHERRNTFSPQDLSRVAYAANVTKCIFLPMPGVHSAQVIVGTPPDSAFITRNLACALLRSWGTQITSTPFGHLNSPKDMAIAYARLVLSLSEASSYQTGALEGRVGGGSRTYRRDFAKTSKMDTYTRGGKGSYWLNEHHRACFAAAYPGPYNLIFESTADATTAVTLQSRHSTFCKDLIASLPLRASLAAKGLVVPSSATTFTMGIGAGRYVNQVNAMWDMAWPLHS